MLLRSVSSDSLSTLMALSKSKAHSAGLSMIAREVALLRAELDLELSRFVHIPGVANKWADALSRMMAPEPCAFPRELEGLPGSVPPARDDNFWVSLFPEGRRLARQALAPSGTAVEPCAGGSLS